MMLKIHRGVGRPASILVVLFFIVALSNTIDAFPTRWLSRSFLRSDPTRKASQIGVTLIRRQTADGGQGLFSIGKRQQSQLLRPWESKSYKEHVQYHNKDSSQTSVDAENWKGVVDFTLKIFYAGFCAHLRLVNPGPDVSVSWRLHATLPPKAKLYTSWSGTYTEVLSNNVSTTTQQEWDVTPEDWNAAIVAGSSKTTGFCARFPSLKEQIDDVPVFDLVFSSNSGSGDDDGGNDGDDDEDCDDDDDNPATVTLIEPVPSSSVSPSLLPTAGPLSPFPNATPSSLPPGPVTPSPTRSPIVSIPSASPPNSVPSATPVVTSSPSLPTVVTPSTTPSATPSATPSVTPSATPATPSSASPSAPSTSPVPSSTTPPPSATPSPSIPASPTFVSPPATPTTTQRPIPTPPSNEGVDLTGLADTGRLLVGYWGQNVAFANAAVTKATSPENEIDAYCSGPYNVLNIAFANVFKNAENTIDINLSSHCGETFPGSTVLNCPLVGQAIRRCQNLGKKVILSLGGGIASVGFSDLADVNRFTLALWNMFLGGTQAGFVRPFGPGVILDGIDLDVEGGDDFGYDIFLRDIRALMDTDASGRKFFITAAPQCFFPDVLQDTAYAKGYFDWLNIQWYNNPCGNFAFPTPAWQDAVEFWVNWANTVSANPNVRLLIGAPSSIAAASPQSFVPLVSTSDTAQPSMTTIIARWKQDYRTRFGGVMLWEVTTADSNENFAQGVRDILDA